MNRHELKKTAVEKAMREHVDEIQKMYAVAKDDGNRELNTDEAVEVETHVKALEDLKVEKASAEEGIKTLQRVDDIGREIGPAVGGVSVVSEPLDRIMMQARKSLGEQFTESEGFKNAIGSFKGGGQIFSTGPVTLETKAGTILEGAQGAGLIPVPQVIPGVVDTLFQPLRVEDLLLSGQTSTNSLRYVVEGTATNSAAAVAEGAAKPASDLALSTKDEPVKKVATVLTVSDEMLEDVQQVQSYINGRLSLFVRIQSEASIVSGAGTNDLVGLTDNARAINKKAAGTVDNNAVALFKAMNGQRGSSFLEPDFIVMNPANWQTTRLLTDTAGQFFGGGPFMGQYGSGANLQASGQISGVQDYIWGKPVIVTTAIGSGTALIGTSSAAQVWSRGGLTVEATNSHSSNFTLNLVTIRAERRLALALYRASAFTLVTGLS